MTLSRRRDAGCHARATGGPPAALAAVAVHADGPELRLDVVMSLFVSGVDPAACRSSPRSVKSAEGPRAGALS
ncbi:hypothetical protein WME95_09085 [Sorangium sp. So ce327]|uniref:hypothetical protein n=1 Tax=Sorangium sp. So ce327 TaxID=3133301 RepID=UPI003F62EF14